MSSNEESPLNPLDSAKFIMERAKNVSIDRSKLFPMSKLISNAMINGQLNRTDWINPDLCPPSSSSDEQIIDWIFFVSTLNFSFWTDENSSDENHSYQRIYKNRLYHGYEAFLAALNQSLENGIDLIDAKIYSEITFEQMSKLFVGSNSSVSLPMLNERVEVLHQTGEILLKKFDGHFHNCLKQINGNAVDLLQLIVQTFPSYRDETFYRGQKVSFYKRAQILINDIWGYFNGHRYGQFQDLDHLTMFADYRVPQVLSHDGILVYSSELKERLNRHEEIPFGDEDECEIRAASILSVDYLVQMVNEQIPFETNIGEQGQRLNSILIDVFIWKRRRELSSIYSSTPFHRTRSIFY